MKTCILGVALAAGVAALLLRPTSGEAALTLPDRVVQDKIHGGWVGQIVAGAWGAPTEFRFNGRIVPAGRVPRWSMRNTNTYTFARPGGPDETYVELPFLDALARDIHAGWPEWGEAFRTSGFRLFEANLRARQNLAAGLAPPASGDPDHNSFAYDIDFQIESNFAGLVAPAQPGAAIDIAWRAGHVVGYGDGVYGGVMVAAMQAEAFSAGSVAEIVEAGRRAVPLGTTYREMIEDVIRWHAAFPGSWQRTWGLLERRWNAHDPAVKRDPEHVNEEFNIDAKLNGAYILLGLLYGRGKFARTIKIAMRAGQDSDCNPNNAGGIIGAWLGYRRIPRRYKRGLAHGRRIPDTSYMLRGILDATARVAGAVTTSGGGSAGPAGWTIPDAPETTPIVEQWPLTPDPKPSVQASAVPDGRTVRFNATAQHPNGVTAFWWSFGDLTDGTGATATHTYREPGTYRAIVWAADPLGRTGTATVTVQVN